MRRPILFLALGLLIGAVVATTLSSPTPADAANGDYTVMGTKNTSRNSTQFISRNSTQFRNTQNGRPAISLTVKPGAPPMAVNSTVKVDKLNADYLDGASAETLKPIATGCSTLDAADGTTFTCGAGIVTAHHGLLIMSGSIEMTNNSADSHDQLYCRFNVDGVLNEASDRDMDLHFDPEDNQDVCATNAWSVVGIGEHSVEFTLQGVNPDTDLGSASMTVIFIPG